MNKKPLGFTILEGLVLGAVFSLIGLVGWRIWSIQSKGGTECVSWVKKIEGANYPNINNLKCSLSPRKVANSSLLAKYLDYSSEAKGGCPLDPGFSGQSPPPGCTGWSGIVLSDGKTYPGVGEGQIRYPSRMDYCYDKTNPNPTTHDVYLYKGDLYDRDVYVGTEIKTPFGTCILNGTTIYHPNPDFNKQGGYSELYTSNVGVQYKDFPNDCFTVTLGRPVEDVGTCIEYITAANANLDSCYTNKTPIVKNGKTTGFKSELQVYVGQYINGNCEQIFVERMAALNKCQDVHITKFVITNTDVSCAEWITNPAQDTTRITDKI